MTVKKEWMIAYNKATKTNTPDKILSKVKITKGCWLWTGYIRKDGYGGTKVSQKHYMVHRYMYELCFGKVPEGLVLDHLCRNRACCNPNHLEPVTSLENIRRGNAGHNKFNTHCKQGHEWTKENTAIAYYAPGKPFRRCKACNREHIRKWRLNNK